METIQLPTLFQIALITLSLVWVPVVAVHHYSTSAFLLICSLFVSAMSSLVLVALNSHSVAELSSVGYAVTDKIELVIKLVDAPIILGFVVVSLLVLCLQLAYGSLSKVNERRALVCILMTMLTASAYGLACLDKDYAKSVRSEFVISKKDFAELNSKHKLASMLPSHDALNQCNYLAVVLYGNRYHSSCKNSFGQAIKLERYIAPKTNMDGLQVEISPNGEKLTIVVYFKEGSTDVNAINLIKKLSPYIALTMSGSDNFSKIRGGWNTFELKSND